MSQTHTPGGEWTPARILHLAEASEVEYAVRACNAHDDLVAALKYCRNSFQRYDDEAGYDYHSNEIDKINDALAKAGEI